MTLTITGTMTVGNIVTVFPQAADIFKKYRIDYCCGGNRPLDEALKEKNIDQTEILDVLNQAYSNKLTINSNTMNWETVTNIELIEHVTETHHAYLYDELPQLSQLVTKIFRVHGTNHPYLTDVYHHYHDLSKELMEHIIKEDEMIFPLIKAYELSPSTEALNKVIEAIIELESEHDQAGQLLKAIRELTEDYTLPEDACMTYSLTFQRLENLEADMFEHIHKENNIMFPRLLNK